MVKIADHKREVVISMGALQLCIFILASVVNLLEFSDGTVEGRLIVPYNNYIAKQHFNFPRTISSSIWLIDYLPWCA